VVVAAAVEVSVLASVGAELLALALVGKRAQVLVWVWGLG